MGSPFEALLVIPFALFILAAIFLAGTFQNSMTFGENNLGTSGFDIIQPQMKQTHYQSRGEFTTTFKTVSRKPVNITSIRIIDKINDELCTITDTSRKTDLRYWEMINITADCPRQNAGDLYTLTATVKYVNNESREFEETGTLTGNIEP